MKSKNSVPIYLDGRHYDLRNKGFVADIPFYSRQIKKYGKPVLELACGTGRVTIPIAEQGIQITGLDISNEMLAQARKKAKEKRVKVEWVKADCRDFNLHKKFNLIIFPFNSIAYLHNLQSIERCFNCVKNHLRKQGGFIIDFFNPRLDLLFRDSSKRYPLIQYPDPDGKGTVVVTESTFYDSATQINKVKNYYKIGDSEEFIEELNMRIFYPQELDALLHYNGFTIESKFGNYDELPFISSSPKQLIVCSKE